MATQPSSPITARKASKATKSKAIAELVPPAGDFSVNLWMDPMKVVKACSLGLGVVLFTIERSVPNGFFVVTMALVADIRIRDVRSALSIHLSSLAKWIAPKE